MLLIGITSKNLLFSAITHSKREFGISYMLNVGVSVYRYLNPIVKVWIILSDMFGT